MPAQVVHAHARGDRGFTLLESLAASAILLVVAVGVISVLITTATWYANAKLRTQAYAVANQVMANILSRNYSDISFATDGRSYVDGAIVASLSWPTSGAAEFTVETSMETTTDPKTGLEMKRIDVTALPVGQALEPRVTVTRYASGWQQMPTDTEKFPVTVSVQLTPLYSTDLPMDAGARVQLLDVDTMAEAYYAVTGSDGTAVFYKVLEGEYFLTCDPRFGTNIRPVRFPMRIAPTHGGSKSNPINTVNAYDLQVTRSSSEALLRVGAYATEGWTVVDGLAQPPEVPYRIVPGLRIYATPVLNTGSAQDTAYFGMGASPLYPTEAQLGTYSATVNAYGVAAIPIPWTIDAGTQYWKLWCRTVDSGGRVSVHTLVTAQPGDWSTQVQRPEGASGSAAYYGGIPQWSRLGIGVTPDNDPTPPDTTVSP